MNPYDETQRNRFFRSVEGSFRGLEWARNLNKGLVEEYAGNGYGVTKAPGREMIVNLLQQAVDAYTMSLVANRPRVMVSTQDLSKQGFAKQYELAINNLIQEIGLEYTLRQWVIDAFFCIGVLKTHMADSGLVQLQPDVWMDPGKPFASNVSIDNFVYDMGAKKYSEVKYAGDMYRIPFEDLQANFYDQNAVKDIQPTSKYAIDGERLDRISRGVEVDHDEFEPMVDLADIWVPRDGKIYTFAVSRVGQFQLKGLPVSVMDWDGPEFGPYHILGFNDVPENIMPSSPASHLAVLSRNINNILRKQVKRAKNQRNVHAYDPAYTDAAKNIQRAGDDQFVSAIGGREGITTVSIGGVDPSLAQFTVSLIDLFDRAAGNLPAMLGLGAQTDTVGQEQLVHSAVSKKGASMQYRVVDGAVRVVRNLAHMLWNDEFKTIPGNYQIEGTNYSVDMSWTPDQREGGFSDYEFNIDMYSMPYQSPAAKLAQITTYVTQVFIPALQLVQSQGGTINMQEMSEIFSDLMNSPELKRIVEFTTPPTEMASMESPGMPANTTRNYVRKSSSSAPTQSGKSQMEQQAWASLGTQGQKYGFKR